MSMTRGLVLMTVVWILVGGTASAQGAPDLKDPEMISAGHGLFLEKQCAHCHGEDGQGGVNLAKRELDPIGVFQSISDGRERNGIRMPAWREVLTDEQIWQATAYVMSISHHDRRNTGPE
jgi:mono/diheme cytochrome c family protein